MSKIGIYHGFCGMFLLCRLAKLRPLANGIGEANSTIIRCRTDNPYFLFCSWGTKGMKTKLIMKAGRNALAASVMLALGAGSAMAEGTTYAFGGYAKFDAMFTD